MKKFSITDMKDIIIKCQKTPNLITIRELARRCKKRQEEILDICEGEGLNVNIGIRVGSGVAEYSSIGDYTVEDLSVDL